MPSQIKNFAELIEVLSLQKQNLGTYFTQCNANAADVTAIINDLNNLTAIAAFAELTDGFKKTIFEIKQALYDGDPLEAIPQIPPALGGPALVSPLSGALSRARDRNRRFKAGPGYTDAIGDALGIGPGGVATDPIDTPPTLDVVAAETGYLYSVVVSNRRQSDQWELLVRAPGGTWTSMGSRTTKSSDFTYNPGASAGDDVSIQLELRVQLKKNDANYSPPSAIVLATVNP